MSSIALSFNNVDLTPINDDGQVWLTSSEIAKALSYSRSDSVTKIYSRNSDEFSKSMTKVVKNPHNPNLTLRVFSLRGCHLLAMFARTKVAKDFRKWVLNVLDDEVDKINAERDSLSFQYNQACATTALVQRDLSQAGRDLRHLGQKVMPELLEKLAALENKIQPQLPNIG